jgi:predicted DCC family thiol-disulfide oxidoreductase YuxK
VQKDPEKYNIVFFDGVCNFCNSTVDIIYRRNKAKDIYYSSLQSEFARSFLAEHHIDSTDLDTIIYYSNNNFYFRSDAILQLSKKLSGLNKLLPAFLIVPKFLRDGVYSWIARNRYKFWGKKETCRIPTAEEKQHFLE